MNAASVVVEGHTEWRILDDTYAAGLRARPALLVRGSSRRITIMRCPTREYQSDQPSRQPPRPPPMLRARETPNTKTRKTALMKKP